MVDNLFYFDRQLMKALLNCFHFFLQNDCSCEIVHNREKCVIEIRGDPQLCKVQLGNCNYFNFFPLQVESLIYHFIAYLMCTGGMFMLINFVQMAFMTLLVMVSGFVNVKAGILFHVMSNAVYPTTVEGFFKLNPINTPTGVLHQLLGCMLITVKCLCPSISKPFVLNCVCPCTQN